MAQAEQTGIVDTFAPPIQLIAKVGSILVHVDEALSDDGHHFDWAAIRSMLADREVQRWIVGLQSHALVPVKRKKIEATGATEKEEQTKS